MKTDLEITLDFLMRAVADKPVELRCAVYRTAAEWCGNEAETRQLHKLAMDLESASQRCRQFEFRFR